MEKIFFTLQYVMLYLQSGLLVVIYSFCIVLRLNRCATLFLWNVGEIEMTLWLKSGGYLLMVFCLSIGVQLQLQLNQDLSILHQDDGSSKNKRGVLPKHATNVMRSWLFQHIGVSLDYIHWEHFLFFGEKMLLCFYFAT